MLRKSVFFVWLLALVFVWICLPQTVYAQEITATPAAISLPQDGATVTGVVNINGWANSAWSLDFSYVDNPTGTWFGIARSGGSAPSGIIASWDTKNLSDGDYVLRLRVFVNTAAQDSVVTVHVRNYLPTTTITPAVTPSATPAATATVTMPPTPTLESATATLEVPTGTATMLPALPPNPAALDPKDILITLGKGMLAVVIVFALAGLILSMRRN